MSGFLSELIGTMILITLGGGVVAGSVLKKSKAEGGGWLLITVGWGLAVAMGAYAVGKYSGAHLNPALTIGFAVIGKFPWSKVPEYVAGQLIGAFIGSCIVYIAYLPHWSITNDPVAKFSVFSTDPAIDSPVSNLMAEIIGTFILVLGILFIGANKFTDGLNPFIVGGLIVIIGLSLGGPTGYAINPARDIGPRIAHTLLPIPGKGSSQWHYAWVPVVGPLVGGIYGALFYQTIFLGHMTAKFWMLSALILILIILQVSIESKKSKKKKQTLKKAI